MTEASDIRSSERRWLVLLAVCWVAELAITWERWGNPLVDCGREMNLPLRLARGETLYSQVSFLYGPFSPYLNAGLYKIFGVSLGVLYAEGILTATLILALVYRLSRLWMNPEAAGVATISVMGMCALKPSGNYILPYSYSALHGCAAGLGTLLLALRYVQTRRVGWIFAAGVCAAVAVLAKSEFGAGALMAGGAAAALTELPDTHKAVRSLAAFVVPALGISGAVYAIFLRRVGWRVMNHDNHVFFGNIPAGLAYFNLRLLGADRPGRNFVLMVGVALQLLCIAWLLALLSRRIAERGEADSTARAGASSVSASGAEWTGFAIAVSCGLAGFGINFWFKEWQSGPFVAAPLYLTVAVLALLWRAARDLRKGKHADTQIVGLLVASSFALVMLARLVLRVRSGGSYGSYLLPASVVLFVYAWAEGVPRWLVAPQGRPLARQIALTVLGMAAGATLVTVTYRYRSQPEYALTTGRGEMKVNPAYGMAFEQAIQMIDGRTAPGDAVAVLPEGTSLDFLTDRRNPLREEIVTPGLLDERGEQQAIASLRETDAKLVFVANRPTPEFGAPVFGRDYDRQLMDWIGANYSLCQTLGEDTRPPLEIGDERFFIRAYCQKQSARK